MRLFARHDGRHARPRGRFLTWLLGEETGTVLAVPADVRVRLPQYGPDGRVCCPRCERLDPSAACRGCYCHDEYPARVMPAVKVGGAWLPLAGDRVSGTLDDSGMMPAVRVCAGRSVRTIWQPPPSVPRRGPGTGWGAGTAAPGGFQTAWDRYRATGLTGLAWVDGILTAPRYALEAAA